VFDHVTNADVVIAEQQALRSSILIFDGIFLHRPELRDYWDFSVYLEVSFDVSVARCAARDGTSPDPEAAANRRYVEGQRLYLLACDPRAKATMTIDYNDLSKPRIAAARSDGISKP
jgi:uridine kinase